MSNKDTENDVLSEVKNVKFTSREIDILAVILNNRGEKKMVHSRIKCNNVVYSSIN